MRILFRGPQSHASFPGLWGLLDENTPNRLLTLDQVFDDGLKVGRGRQFLGYRPVVSTDPLKFADRYEWLTWDEVDNRRKYIGSALHSLFQKGEVGGGEYETVGIWAANRPGLSYLHMLQQSSSDVLPQNGRSSTLPCKPTTRFLSVCMTP